MSLTARTVADACTGLLLLQLRCYRTRGQTASLQNLLSFIAKALTQRDGIDSTVDGATSCVSEASNISISHSCNLETRVCQCRVRVRQRQHRLDSYQSSPRGSMLSEGTAMTVTRRVEMTLNEEQQDDHECP